MITGFRANPVSIAATAFFRHTMLRLQAAYRELRQFEQTLVALSADACSELLKAVWVEPRRTWTPSVTAVTRSSGQPIDRRGVGTRLAAGAEERVG